jgi:hypothetical protein
MRRIIPVVLLSAVCAMGVCTAGCVPSWLRLRPDDAPPPRPVTERPPAGPVTADQVTPKNAHAVSQALWDELDAAKAPPEIPVPSRNEPRKDQR